jgi:hypothetical protein
MDVIFLLFARSSTIMKAELMNITHLKNIATRKNRCLIGLIICVLMFAPLGNVFADTVICVDDTSTPMSMMGSMEMDADMNCCADVDLCKASCDLSMFSAPVLLDSTAAISISKSIPKFSSYQMDFLPFLPPPPLIRPPVSV